MQRNMSGRGGSFRPQPGGGSQVRGARDDSEQAAMIDVSAIRFGKPIDPRLYSDIAQRAAEGVSPGQRGTRNKPTQLRRFYDELVMLQEKVGSDDAKYEQQAPFIQMLKAKVAYAKGREKVDVNFEVLLRRVVDQATNAETLKQAKLFMEAFMAFYKVYGPKD